MDLVGPLPLSSNKNKYILTIFDQLSRFVVTVPIPDKSAKTVCSSLYSRWISLFGTPDSIRTDAGTEFNNSFLQNMMKRLGVQVKVGTQYNHQSNPVERFHKTLWALLRGKMSNGEQDWEKSLPSVELAYNASVHASTGCSPARGFLGREIELPHLILLPKYNTDQEQDHHDLEADIDRIWDMMRTTDEVRIRRQFRAYSERQEDLQVGDLVYAAVLPPISNSRKLQLRWSGPLVIKDILNNNMIRVEEI